MKTLPSLYKNENIRFKDNNKTNCVIKESINDNVLDTIKNIFNSKGYTFDEKVIIKTKEKTMKTYLVTFKPMEPYFFGNEKNFVYPKSKDESVKSNK